MADGVVRRIQTDYGEVTAELWDSDVGLVAVVSGQCLTRPINIPIRPPRWPIRFERLTFKRREVTGREIWAVNSAVQDFADYLLRGG